MAHCSWGLNVLLINVITIIIVFFIMKFANATYYMFEMKYKHVKIKKNIQIQ